MIKGKTSTGFNYEISKKRLENYELLEEISELETNELVVPKIVKLLLGDDVQKLKDHCRDEDGMVSSEKMLNEITEIFQSKDLKK